MEILFEELGHSSVQTYEKIRESFLIGDTEVLIDTMSFSLFLELEGSPASIKITAQKLELDWSKKITLNYLQIFSNISERLNLDFKDITFKNFGPIMETFRIEDSDIGL